MMWVNNASYKVIRHWRTYVIQKAPSISGERLFF